MANAQHNLGTNLVSRAENTHSSPILIHTSKREGGRYQKYITFHFITFHFVTPPFIHHSVNPQTPWGISATLTHTHTHIYAAIYWTRRDRKIQRAAFICCGVLSSWMLLRLTHGVDILIPAVESGQFLLQVGFSIASSRTLLARGSTPLYFDAILL